MHTTQDNTVWDKRQPRVRVEISHDWPTSQVHSQKRETAVLRRTKENLIIDIRGDIRDGRLLQLQKTLPPIWIRFDLVSCEPTFTLLWLFNHCYLRE